MTSDGLTLMPGDVLLIERRYLVDGVLQTSKARGVFAGVQIVGSAEHLVIEGSGRSKRLRLVPLSSVSEITLVKAVPRNPKPAQEPAWDMGVA